MAASQQHFSELISKFEEQQKQLLQQRKNTLKSLTNVRRSERYFRSEEPTPNKGQSIRRKSKEDLEKGPAKREDEVEADADKPKPEVHSPKKHEHHGIQLPKTIEQRFKRMMGDMSKHLVKAKTKLESEEEQAKKKAELEREAIQQQNLNVRVLKDEKRQSLAKSKEDLIKKKDELARSLLHIENSLLEAKFKKYISRLEGFIHTKTLPVLLWRPAQPNDTLTKLATESTEQLKAKEEHACKLVQSLTEPIQFSKVVVQNQTEYLNNASGRHCRRLIGNILTESKPALFWRPAEWNTELRKLEAHTTEALQQKLQQQKLTLVKPNKTDESSEEASESEAEHD